MQHICWISCNMAQKDMSKFELTLETKVSVLPLSLEEFSGPLIPEQNLCNNIIKYEQKTSEKGKSLLNLCTDLVVHYDIMNNIHDYAIKIEKAFIILIKIVTEKKAHYAKCEKIMFLAKIGEEIIKKLLKAALLKHYKIFVSRIQHIKIQELTCKVANFCTALSKVINGKQILYKKCSKIIISAKIRDEIFKCILMKSCMKKFKNAITDVILIKHFYKTFLKIFEIEVENVFLDEVHRKVKKITEKEKNQNQMLSEDIANHIQYLAKNKQTKKINKGLLQETSKFYNSLLISNHENSQKLQEIKGKNIKLGQAYDDLIIKAEKTHQNKVKLESESNRKAFLLETSNKTSQDLENQISELSESILIIRSNLENQKFNEHKLFIAQNENQRQKDHKNFLTEKLKSSEQKVNELQYKNQSLQLSLDSLKNKREKNMKIIARKNEKHKKAEEKKDICKNLKIEIPSELQKSINRMRSRSPRMNFPTKPLRPINLPSSLSPRRPNVPIVTSRQSFDMSKGQNFSKKPVACNNFYNNQAQVTTYSWSLGLLLVLFIILLIIY